MRMTGLFARSALVLGLVAALGLGANGAAAQSKDTLVIGYPSDVPSWDPIAHTHAFSMSIFKSVFDSPLTQAPDLSLKPNIITKWGFHEGDPSKLAVELRDDVYFHNGDKLTAEDFKFTFETRVHEDEKLAMAGVWGRRVKEIEVVSPTKAIVHLHEPMPTAPQWWAFLGNFFIPKDYYTKVGGKEEFMKAPIGAGPYKLVEYQRGSRIVLEANDRYWGEKPKVKRVIFEILKDASARVAAIQSKRVDITMQVPIREAVRLDKIEGLSAKIEPFTQIILLQVGKTGAFLDQNVRLAAHHAVNKSAISKALYAGQAVPLSVTQVPGAPGHVKDFEFPFDEAKAKELLAKSGFSPEKPVKLTMLTTNGAFPNDFEVARAIGAMWKKVGIDANIEVIELAKYYELNHTNNLPEATLFSWDNSTADPEMFTGYILHPGLRFSAWKSDDMLERLSALFKETDYDKRIAGYTDTNRYAVEQGYSIPLLQSVVTVVARDDLDYPFYSNGWILPQFYSWK